MPISIADLIYVGSTPTLSSLTSSCLEVSNPHTTSSQVKKEINLIANEVNQLIAAAVTLAMQ